MDYRNGRMPMFLWYQQNIPLLVAQDSYSLRHTSLQCSIDNPTSPAKKNFTRPVCQYIVSILVLGTIVKSR